MARIDVVQGRIDIVVKGGTKQVSMSLYDDNDALVDAAAGGPVLTVSDLSGAVLTVDTYGAASSRIVRSGLGRYYFPFGSAVPNDETQNPRDLVFTWTATPAGGSDQVLGYELVRVVTPRTLSFVIRLQNFLDKAVKTYTADAPVGYSLGLFSQWLDGGLQMVNALPPHPAWLRVDDFPDAHAQTLIDAAAIVGLTGQAIFAIDTDIPNYQDNGNAFPLDHHPRLMAQLQFMATRLDAIVPKMKLQFLQNGALHVQIGPHFKLAVLTNTAPNGALFRNLFAAG